MRFANLAFWYVQQFSPQHAEHRCLVDIVHAVMSTLWCLHRTQCVRCFCKHKKWLFRFNLPFGFLFNYRNSLNLRPTQELTTCESQVQRHFTGADTCNFPKFAIPTCSIRITVSLYYLTGRKSLLETTKEANNRETARGSLLNLSLPNWNNGSSILGSHESRP